MQDAKEQPPPTLPEDIVKMSKYKSPSDENPRDVFWRLVEAYKEGEKFGELVKQYDSLRQALLNIGCSVLEENPRGYRVKVSKTLIAKAVFAMIMEGGWGDSLERVLSNMYQRKKGPEVNMLVAFGNAFAQNGEVMGAWLKSLLAGERPSEEVLAYVLHSGDRKIVEYLREELLNIARTEINEPQVFAMEALGVLLPDDKDVRKVYVDMMDDWDAETKKAALNVLKRVEVAEAGKKAVSMYAGEQDEAIRIELEEIIAKNKVECAKEFGKAASLAGKNEREGLKALAMKVYGKKLGAELIEAGLREAGVGGSVGEAEG